MTDDLHRAGAAMDDAERDWQFALVSCWDFVRRRAVEGDPEAMRLAELADKAWSRSQAEHAWSAGIIAEHEAE